jgi:hypothetical protein
LKGTRPETIPARFGLKPNLKVRTLDEMFKKICESSENDPEHLAHTSENTFKSSPLKLLNQIKTNLAEVVLGWSPVNIVSDSPALHSKWLLLLLHVYCIYPAMLTRGPQEPVIAHLVFNLTSKVDRKWGCYT